MITDIKKTGNIFWGRI